MMYPLLQLGNQSNALNFNLFDGRVESRPSAADVAVTRSRTRPGFKPPARTIAAITPRPSLGPATDRRRRNFSSEVDTSMTSDQVIKIFMN